MFDRNSSPHDLCEMTLFSTVVCNKGPFNNYVDKMRGGGQKISVFVHAQSIKLYTQEGGVKNGKFLST